MKCKFKRDLQRGKLNQINFGVNENTLLDTTDVFMWLGNTLLDYEYDVDNYRVEWIKKKLKLKAKVILKNADK